MSLPVPRVRIEVHHVVYVDDDGVEERIEVDAIERVTLDEARGMVGFMAFVFALLVGPACGGGGFVIHWFAGIVFAFVPILVGLVFLTVGVIRRPRLCIVADGEERVWRLPRDLDFEAMREIVRQLDPDAPPGDGAEQVIRR